MAIIRKIDELNMLSYENILDELYDYFREMEEITEEQVEERVDIAKNIYSLIAMFLFLVNGTETVYAVQDIDYYVEMLNRRYTDIIAERYPIDTYLQDYADFVTLEIVNATFNNMDDDYFLSQDRALDIAKTEGNTIVNYEDYRKAKEEGYTKKTWITQRDRKVRRLHQMQEGKTVGIDEYFVVGTDLMRFPHDLSMNPKPENVINCRCHIKYTK